MTVQDGDIVRVRAFIELPSLVEAQNVYYWKLDDPVPASPSNTQVSDALDTKITAMYEDLEGEVTDEMTVDHIEIEKIEWATDHWETVENLDDRSILVAGTTTADMVPHGAAAVITGNTSRPQTRARKFIPGILEARTLESTLTGPALAALGAYAVEWLTDLLLAGSAYLVPAVVGQSGPSAGLSYLLTEAIVSSIIGYQRRRKPGVGS